MRARKSIPCSANARPARLAALAAAMLALSACAGEGGPQSGALAEKQAGAGALAPYNGLATGAGKADPVQLLGLSGGDITTKLGKPALIRRDGEAEVWQYRRVRCVLDVFLYGDDKQVEHVDLRDRGDATEAAVRECFLQMLERAPASI